MKKGLQAFTLVEILVAITVIGIIGISFTRIDFNQVTDKQRVSIFSNKIVTTIEGIRNLILTGKSVTVGQYISSEWTINIPINSPLSTLRPYYRDSGGVLVAYDTLNYNLQEKELVESVTCRTIDGVSTMIGGGTFTISFTKDITTFTCPNVEERIVEILVKFRNEYQTITFNGISNIVESVN